MKVQRGLNDQVEGGGCMPEREIRRWMHCDRIGGAEEIRTPDPLNAIQVLFQLSYSPTRRSGCRFTFEAAAGPIF